MKKNLAWLLVASSGLAYAGSFNFGAHVNERVSLSVLPYASGENDESDYVGLTQGYINGDPTNEFYMYCVDFLDAISVPTTYDVVVRVLAPGLFTSDALGLTLDQLQMQATLGSYFGSSPSGDSARDSDVQHLIWSYTGGNFSVTPNMVTLHATAFSSYSGRDFDSSVLLDITGAHQQAFMTQQITTPEPNTAMLLAAGFILAELVRKKQKTTKTSL